MDDTEVVEGVLVVGFEGLTERMENSLKRVVVLRGKKLAGDDVGVADIPSRVDCLVVIRVSMFDVGSWIGHLPLHPTGSQALTYRACRV
ncbi:hypothetical protein [Natronosalvus amylolyticus]|uniref:hypothetical protein n=1 Tax=Natronosalvus amylolyticus TaxID=2961994 RepID=UPI0020C9D48B|nr:hypothetical protein [Natronosalvus amylolyticus]